MVSLRRGTLDLSDITSFQTFGQIPRGFHRIFRWCDMLTLQANNVIHLVSSHFELKYVMFVETSIFLKLVIFSTSNIYRLFYLDLLYTLKIVKEVCLNSSYLKQIKKTHFALS